MASAGNQIMGLPFALYLASELDWHAAFGLILILGIIAAFLIFWKITPVNKHLQGAVKVYPLHHSLRTISNRNYLLVFSGNTLLVSGDIILMTFSSGLVVILLMISTGGTVYMINRMVKEGIEHLNKDIVSDSCQSLQQQLKFQDYFKPLSV